MKNGFALDEEATFAEALFQPDMLLGAEYLETVRRKSYLEPEKRLMLAILEDAVVCFRRYRDGQKQKALFRETARWIMDESTDSLFSFRVICEVLGISSDYLRRGLFRDTAVTGEGYPHLRLSRS